MLKKCAFLFLLSLYTLSIISCQPTPNNPFVVSKGDGKLQQIIAGEPAPSLIEPYQVPLNWTETIDNLKDNKLIIEVNSSVTVPQSLTYPVFRVQMSEMSLETAESFARYFIGDENVYDYGERSYTDEYLQSLIDMCEYQLNDPASPLNTTHKAKSEEAYEFVKGEATSRLDQYLEQLAQPKNRKAVNLTFDSGTDIRAYTDGLRQLVMMTKKETLVEQMVAYYRNGVNCNFLSGTYAISNNLIDIRLSKEEAKFQAGNALNELGYSDWNLVNCGAAGFYKEDYATILWDNTKYTSRYDQPQRFWFTYTPNIFEDIPLLYYSNTNRTYNQGQMELVVSDNTYGAFSAFQPSLHISVGDDGINHAVLINDSMDMLDTVNTNVPLLAFTEIQEVFRRYIVMNANFNYDIYREELDEDDPGLEVTTIKIDDVRLGYMKIREKDSATELLIPVWMFYGTQHDRYASQEMSEWQLDGNNEKVMETPAGFTFLIINAIDGSVIDPILGY